MSIIPTSSNPDSWNGLNALARVASIASPIPATPVPQVNHVWYAVSMNTGPENELTLLARVAHTASQSLCDIVEFQCKDGSKYRGQILDGKFHGKGKLTNPMGDVYEGSFINDRSHGLGQLITRNGTIYVGEFAYGYFHGKGKLTYPNGLTYEGRFGNGKFEEPHERH